ncbi:MAG: hypothetical protein RLZZ347_36 [Candidatus Parcubacteria bacterium]|jgi:cell division protein FtsA
MARNIAVGIDIGTYQIKVVVAELGKEKTTPHIIGMGFAESKGLRHGYIVNANDAVKCIKTAIAQAEKIAKVPIKHAHISVGGIGLSSLTSTGTAVITRADLEITELDIKKAIEVSKNEIPASASLNRRILHTIPLQYKVDGQVVYGKFNGMKGNKLEVKTLFIVCLEQHYQELTSVVNDAGIEIEDVVASPVAASLVTLSKQQKTAGCLLANIGSETVSIVVFENNIPTSLEVFPIGSTDITNDIALGLKVSLEDAEKLKLGGILDSAHSRKKLDEIILARLSDIFELIEVHLKKIGRSGLLPAGIIITGGGSGITTIEDFAKASLKLPSRIGNITFGPTLGDRFKDATWSVAYGLCILGLSGESEGIKGGSDFVTKDLAKQVGRWFKQFLP